MAHRQNSHGKSSYGYHPFGNDPPACLRAFSAGVMQERQSLESSVGFELCKVSACRVNKTTPHPKIRRLNFIFHIFQQKVFHGLIEMTNFFIDDPLINIQE
jgi:hypothetical protein